MAYLVNDSDRLAHFFHSAEISVEAIASCANRNVKFDQIVGIIRCYLSDVPLKSTHKR